MTVIAWLKRVFSHASRGFPQPPAPPRTGLEYLRRRAFREQYRHAAAPLRAGIALFSTFFYPFAAASNICEAIRHLPRFGVPVQWIQFFPMYAQALLRNIPPVEYLLFGFSDRSVRRTSGEYLYWMDQPAIQWLNRQRGAENVDVQNKAQFAAICLRLGLPHAKALAEFRGGVQVAGTPPLTWGATEVWTKPTSGSGGRGCRLWRRLPDGFWQSNTDRLSPGKWADLLQGSNCIVQHRLQNHPDVVGLTNGAAIVVRLVTVLDRAGCCTLIGSSVALPQGSGDSTTGGLGCVPDLETGAIVKVSLAGSDASTTHPDTGERLVGRVLPCWEASRELALRAHREAFPAFASLGWDVVVTPEGPVLLEANSGWGTMGQQIDFGPLGRSAFGPIALHELERASCV